MIAALLALSLLQPASPPDPAVSDPDKAGAMAAIGAFAYGCVEQASIATSAAAYADAATAIGHGAKDSAPEVTALPFSIEGVGGNTCRVTYHGAYVDTVWKAFSDFSRDRMNGVCTDGPASERAVSIRCAANRDNPAYSEQVERTNDRIAASFTWLGPRLP